MRRPNEAIKRLGDLSNPSKMPTLSWSIPATYCKVGTLLQRVAASTCSLCYALGGRYVMPGVVAAMERRYASLTLALSSSEGRAAWVADWVSVFEWRAQQTARAIERKGRAPRDDGRYWRWHDSGDIQGENHFAALVDIAKACPGVAFWLPTREYVFVLRYLERWGADSLPGNLCVRLSTPSRNQEPTGLMARLGDMSPQVAFSTVNDQGEALAPGAVECMARRHSRTITHKGERKTLDGYCSGLNAAGEWVECRACWFERFITYPTH